MKTKLLLIILIISNLNIVGCEIYNREEKELLLYVNDFFDTQYEAYSSLRYIDIEKFLDMSKIQNQNKIVALKKLIIQRKHIEDMDYTYINKRKYPIGKEVKDVNINGQYASLKIELDLERNLDYPVFISKGLNSFVLKMEENQWKIVYHDYEGMNLFEGSTKELLPEIDEARIRKAIDNEYVSPLS